MRCGLLSALIASGAAAACAGVISQAAPRQLSARERAELVRAHNELRERVGSRPLRWSDDLADDAAAWAERLSRKGCRLSHDRSSRAGENLFWASSSYLGPSASGPVRRELTPAYVVNAWGEESRDYSHARQRCARGRQCGHYVQIIWPATTQVGCGASTCAKGGEVWVCRYEPGVVRQ